MKSNRWVKWIEIYCSGCKYRENVENFDFIQPTSPFFQAIYGNDPIALSKRQRREKESRDNNLKDDREIGLMLKVKEGILKPWEIKDVKSYTRERGLE